MPIPKEMKERTRDVEHTRRSLWLIKIMTIVMIIVLAKALAKVDGTRMREHEQDRFQRAIHRKALPGPRPKDKPLGGQAVEATRSYLSALTEWFVGNEYREEWIEQIKMFENAPLYTGSIEQSTVHSDKLNKSVREVGYGITDAEICEAKRFGFLPPDATLPQVMSKEEADQWFENVTIPTYEKCVEEIVDVPLTCEQKFALISFCHNLGKGNLEKMAMQDGRLKDSNYYVIDDCMLRYTNAGKHKNVAGLVKRRNWEAELWRSGTHNYSEGFAAR